MSNVYTYVGVPKDFTASSIASSRMVCLSAAILAEDC